MHFKYYLSSYKKSDLTYAIRLKISTSKNDIQYIDSKISVLKNQFDTKKQKIKKHILEENLNASLDALKTKVQKIYLKNEEVNAAELLVLYKNRNNNAQSFIDFYYELLAETKLKKQFRTSITLNRHITNLKKFKNPIYFKDIDLKFAKAFETWMLKKGNKTNTIANNFSALKAALNKAVKRNIIIVNPLNNYTIKKENIERPHLTFEEINKIIDLEIEEKHNGMIRARDMFLFSFYSAGMRFSDMCKLKWSNIKGDNIVYIMSKSKKRAGSKRTIPLNKKSLEIINKYKGKNKIYIFPILYGYEKVSIEEMERRIFNKNSTNNRSLKIISKRLDLDVSLSMHIAKHSFANYAVNNNVGVLILSKLLGHTNLSTTQHYLKDFYHKEESDTMNDLFN